jgi:serine/threonine-protein kinase
MPLPVGDKLGHYEILAPIGAGGMGEVYRARDGKLKRDVALKVLPEAFARDAERMARFQREAEVLASLNHPNIAHIYGVEDRALVMELVEGSAPKGPLPFDEAWKIASQIAGALEYAHERGIMHRDLKPANIMITPEGVVKLLDFGLAKAFTNRADASARPSSPGGPENSPTLTIEATEVGVILGTAAYMPPEQAKGKTVDKRADIWAFGVVFYELLSGERLFKGEDVSDTLAQVLTKEPDLNRVPPQARKLLARCLEKDPKKRLRDIGEAAYLLNGGDVGQGHAVAAQRHWLWPAVAAAMAIALAGVSWIAWRATRPAEPRPPTRLSVDLGPEAVRAPRLSAILSPDGARIVFAGRASGGLVQLYTRRLDQPGVTVLTGTEGSDPEPFFSPDGEWIGFTASGKVMKVAAHGGSPITLSTLPAGAIGGGSWGEDNNIILGTLNGLYRVPGAGGVAQQLKDAGGAQVFPQVLPGAREVLFNGANPRATIDLEGLDIEALQFATGAKKTLLRGGYWPRYLPTSREIGHLIYMHEGTLFGVGFDPQRLELLGTPAPLLDDVAASASPVGGGGQFAFSDAGMLVYLSGRAQQVSYPIAWLDTAGKITPLVAQPGVYGAPRLSPDGKRLAYIASGAKGFDVWVYDMERGAPTQVTFLGSVNGELAWAPDSKHLVYSDGTALWWIRADGSGERQPLLDKANKLNARPGSFAPVVGGNTRLAFSPSTGGLPDIWTMPVDLSDPEHPKPGKPAPFLAEPQIVEVDAAFSPDGKFLAYASNEEDEEQVFVRPFPGAGGKWKVSRSGGKFPAWSASTHELLFLGGDDRIMAVSYSTQGDAFSAGIPRVWSPAQVRRIGVQQSFDVSPDGKRVVVFPRPAADETVGTLHATFLLNFFDEVRRRAPSGK